MSIQYNIYANTGAGDPVSFAAPVATVSTLSWTTTPPGANKDQSYVIRPKDTVTGLEDPSLDARVRIVTDANGNDITGRPLAPVSLSVVLRKNGSAIVSWQYPMAKSAPVPTGFHVYVGTPTPNYASAAATVPYVAMQNGFKTTLTGLVNGATYQVGVRAYNAVAEEPNATVVSFVADATPPLPIQGLLAQTTVKPYP